MTHLTLKTRYGGAECRVLWMGGSNVIAQLPDGHVFFAKRSDFTN